MWCVSGNSLQMAEGDYGIELPVTVNGAQFGDGDSLKFVFKTKMNAPTILEKEYSTIVENTVNLEFTLVESEEFSVGQYVYSLDWYKDGVFMCNIIPCGVFRVVDKA